MQALCKTLVHNQMAPLETPQLTHYITRPFILLKAYVTRDISGHNIEISR